MTLPIEQQVSSLYQQVHDLIVAKVPDVKYTPERSVVAWQRGIHLEDVLLAIERSESGITFTNVSPLIFYMKGTGAVALPSCRWQLNKHLNQQSDETLQFIISILQ